MSWPTMRDPAAPVRFTLRHCGEFALPVLRGRSPCRVIAVFERSFYLEAGGAMACLGNPSIGLGPLNGLLDVPPGMNWLASGLRAGMQCRRGTEVIRLGNRIELVCAEPRVWRPEPLATRPDPATLARALDRLARVSVERDPGQGLALVMAPEHAAPAGNPVRAAAREPVAGCGRWLAAVFGQAAGDHRASLEWTGGLVGLGPGLTPSGDDFLGGVMIALHALDRPGAARTLAVAVARVGGAGGNPISAAHLAAAGEGQGHAALHAAMNAIVNGAGAELDGHLDRLGAIGHCSGWDTLAGVVTALRAWLGIQIAQPHAA